MFGGFIHKILRFWLGGIIEAKTVTKLTFLAIDH